MTPPARRVARAALALAGLTLATSCLFSGPDTFRAIDRSSTDRTPNIGPAFLDVTLVITASGGDAVDVSFPGSIVTRRRIAEIVASWLELGSPQIEENDLVEDVTTIRDRSSKRLIRKARSGWSLTLDTQPLQQGLRLEGESGFNLEICHPAVAATLHATRAPDYDALGSSNLSCVDGFGWSIRTDDPTFRVTVLLLPKTSFYVAYVAGSIVGMALLSAAAWSLGRRLRRGPFRRRNAAAVAIGLVAGGMAAAGFAFAVAMSGALFGPADNLALAKDLGVGMYVAFVALPGLFGTIPGIVFATLLVFRRPWPDEEMGDAPRPWGASSPPPAPPPLPWGGR